jgi:hypothetical protein
MLENSVKWRRSFKPDQLDENVIRLEVKQAPFLLLFFAY